LRSKDRDDQYRTDPKSKIPTNNKSGSAGNFMRQRSGRERSFFIVRPAYKAS